MNLGVLCSIFKYVVGMRLEGRYKRCFLECSGFVCICGIVYIWERVYIFGVVCNMWWEKRRMVGGIGDCGVIGGMWLLMGVIFVKW